MKFAVHGHRDASRLFRNDDGETVALLRDAQGRAVTQTEVFGDIFRMTHGQDATSGADALLGNDHSAIVQRTVLEEEVFEQALADGSIDDFATLHHFFKAHASLQNDERTHLLSAHVDASHHDGQNVGIGHIHFLALTEEAEQA